MPAVYDDVGEVEEEPRLHPRAVYTPPTPTPGPSLPPDENLAEQTLISAHRTRELFAGVAQSTVDRVPDTTAYTAVVHNDQVTTEASQQALDFFAQIYGGENMAAFVSSELIQDPEARERTFAALETLRAQPIQYGLGGGGTGDPLELIQQIFADPSLWATLSSSSQMQVRNLAGELLANLEAMPSTGLAGDFMQAAAVAQSGDVSLALSPQQIADLTNLVPEEFDELGGLRQTGETLPLASVGIEQVRQIGEGVVVLDMDWAKTHPTEAFAAQVWLEQNYPEYDIQYGRGGIVGSLLDKFGSAVDYISAPLGAAIQQASELGDHLRSPEERQKFLAAADVLEASLATGEVPTPSNEPLLAELGPWLQTGTWDTDDVLRSIAWLRDQGTDTTGWQTFQDQMWRNANPRTIAFGFADSATKAADLLPGDPEYGFVYATTGLIANIVADPLTYVTAGVGALRDIKLVPQVQRIANAMDNTEDAVAALRVANPALTDAQALRAVQRARELGETLELSRSWIRSTAYQALARSPEEMAVTKPFMRATDSLAQMRTTLGKRDFETMLAMYFGDTKNLGGGTDVAHFLAQAESADEMGFATLLAQTGSLGVPPQSSQVLSRMNAITRELGDMTGLSAVDRTALVAERARLLDIAKGRDFVRPMRRVFSSGDIRKLERLTDKALDRQTSMLEAAVRHTEDLPAEILRDPVALREAVTPAIEAQTRTMFQRWRDLWQPTGAGELLTFPGGSREARAVRGITGSVEDVAARLRIADPKMGRTQALAQARKIVADSVYMGDHLEKSFRDITAIARNLGIGEDRIRELMRPWVAGELTTPYLDYQWWKSTWTSIIDESPKLDAAGKQDLAKMWPSLVNDRSPGLLGVQNGRYVDYEPTWFKEIIDETTGIPIRSGIPVFEADQFQAWRVPSMESLRSYISHTQRTMAEWRATGGWGKRVLSTAHLGLSQTWTAWNGFWRTAVLAFRFPAGLPARIIGEEWVRMGAMDYASAVWHPWEWFQSTGVGTKWMPYTDLALVGGSPTHALGVAVNMLENNGSMRLARAAREEVTIVDGSAFYRSYSERIGRIYASPSTHSWLLPHLDDPDAAVGVMGRSPEGMQFLDNAVETPFDEVTAVSRAQQEITQMIGSGPGAERVRVAMENGKFLTDDGRIVNVGTVDFANALEDMAIRKAWVPGTTSLMRSTGDYLPASRMNGLRAVRDKLFETFYTAPDLAMARSPLWRQMAAREYRNLIRRGYTPDDALELSRAYAARGTADMLFTIGAKTTGEYWLKNIMPFFPAYRELAATWLLRIPTKLGSGIWPLGAAYMVRRADVFMDFFKNMGIVRTDENGKLLIPLPGFAPIVRMFTGTDVAFDVTAPLDSFAGILPVPSSIFDKDEQGNLLPWYKRLQGMLPTLGGPATFTLGMLNDLSDDRLHGVENWLTLYGTDSSLGPAAVDRAFEAFGITPPWMTATTMDYHRSVRTWAVVDGMRISMGENPQPKWQDFDTDSDGYLSEAEQGKYVPVYKRWVNTVMKDGERYAQGAYLLRSLAGMTLPFSIQFRDEGKMQMDALWGMLNTLPEEAGGETFESAFRDSVLAEYPDLQAYMTGKTQDLRAGIVDPEHNLDEFMQAVKDGDIEVRSAGDWMAFSYGMNSYSIYQSHLDAIFEESGQTASDWLVNFAGKEQVQQEKAAWDHFLDYTDVRENWARDDDGKLLQTKSFREMWENYIQFKQIHEGEGADLSLEQQRLLEFDGMMGEFGNYFALDSQSSQDYYKLREEAFAALGKPTSELGRGVAWWYTNVSDPYYTARNLLYDKLDETPDRRKPLIYDELRELADQYNKGYTNPDHPEWGIFVSPEEYVFLKLDETEQAAQITKWANLPGTYLTQFQREQVGYDIPDGKQDEANKLSSLISEGDFRFDEYVGKHGLSTASTAVVEWRAQIDAYYAERAEKMGLTKYYRQMNQPEYVRIGQALNLGAQSKAWTWASDVATELGSRITNAGYSPGGTSAIAETYHKWMVNAVAKVRQQDAAFDAILTQLGQDLGEDGNPMAPDDLVLKLFFGVYSTSQAFYLD